MHRSRSYPFQALELLDKRYGCISGEMERGARVRESMKMFFIDTLDGCFQSSLRPTGYVERIRLLPIAQNRLDTEENPIKCSSLGQLSL